MVKGFERVEMLIECANQFIKSIEEGIGTDARLPLGCAVPYYNLKAALVELERVQKGELDG